MLCGPYDDRGTRPRKLAAPSLGHTRNAGAGPGVPYRRGRPWTGWAAPLQPGTGGNVAPMAPPGPNQPVAGRPPRDPRSRQSSGRGRDARDRLPSSAAGAPGPPPGVPAGAPATGAEGPPPSTKGDAGFWLFLTVLGFLGGQIVAYIATVVAAVVAGESKNLSAIAQLAAPPEWYVGASLVGLWVGFLGAPWLASYARGTRHFAADLGIRFRPVDVLGIAVGAAGQLLVYLMYLPFQKDLHNFNGPTTKLTGGAHGAGFVVIAVLTVVGAPFFEELFFRGLLFRALARLLAPGSTGGAVARAAGAAGAVALDGLLFGLAHAELQQLAGLAVFGMILAFVCYRTGRLGMNMVAHASFNLVAVISLVSSRGGVIH